jgi:hypothetical protein
MNNITYTNYKNMQGMNNITYTNCKNIHGMNNIKFANAQQAKAVYNYKNTKERLCKTNAAICRNTVPGLAIGLVTP